MVIVKRRLVADQTETAESMISLLIMALLLLSDYEKWALKFLPPTTRLFVNSKMGNQYSWNYAAGDICTYERIINLTLSLPALEKLLLLIKYAMSYI